MLSLLSMGGNCCSLWGRFGFYTTFKGEGSRQAVDIQKKGPLYNYATIFEQMHCSMWLPSYVGHKIQRRT